MDPFIPFDPGRDVAHEPSGNSSFHTSISEEIGILIFVDLLEIETIRQENFTGFFMLDFEGVVGDLLLLYSLTATSRRPGISSSSTVAILQDSVGAGLPFWENDCLNFCNLP